MLTWQGFTGPVEQDRRAEAAIKGGVFGFQAVTGAFAGEWDSPAVVHKEEDSGVFGEVTVGQELHEGGDGIIKPFDGGVIGLGFGVEAFVSKEFEIIRRWVVRGVWQHGSVPEEEGGAGGFVKKISDWLHGLAADGEAGVAMAAFDRHAVGEAGVGIVTFPEFAGLETSVTEGRQDAWQSWGSGDEGVGFITFGAFGWVVEADAVLVSVLACEQGGEACAAEGGWDIAVDESG